MAPTLKIVREDCYQALVSYFMHQAVAQQRAGGLQQEGVNVLPLPETLLTQLKKTYPNAKIDREINTACDFIARLGQCLWYEASAGITGIDDYWFFLPSYAGTVDKVYWQKAGETTWVELYLQTQDELNVRNRNWETDTVGNTPQFYCFINKQRGHGSGHSIKLFPKPSTAGYVKITGTRLPDEVVDEEDIVPFEGSWYQLLIDYVLYHLVGDVNRLKKVGELINVLRMESEDRHISDQRRIVDLNYDAGWGR